MRPDQDVIDSDLSISTHRITAAILRGDPDQARRTIAAESRVLFLLGAAHIDREMGKVRSRRLPPPSTDRVVPLLAARAQMAMDHAAAQQDAVHAARTALAATLCREALTLGRATRAREHGAQRATFNDRTVVLGSDSYYESLAMGEMATYDRLCLGNNLRHLRPRPGLRDESQANRGVSPARPGSMTSLPSTRSRRRRA